MLHILPWLYIYVSSVYSNCFISFKRMLQVFSYGFYNVCNDYTYFQFFSGVLHMFQTYVTSVLSECGKSRLDVHILNGTYFSQPPAVATGAPPREQIVLT
jgi:hypothetical protein